MSRTGAEVTAVKRLRDLLRSRCGETLVELMVSIVVFLMLFAVLSGAVGFASKAQRRAETIRGNAAALQKSVRENAAQDGGAANYEFHITDSGESAVDSAVRFRVRVKQQTITARDADGQSVTFHVFGTDRTEATP